MAPSTDIPSVTGVEISPQAAGGPEHNDRPSLWGTILPQCCRGLGPQGLGVTPQTDCAFPEGEKCLPHHPVPHRNTSTERGTVGTAAHWPKAIPHSP